MAGGGWWRRARWAMQANLAMVAVFASGCFHLGPSARQAMTSAAPKASISATSIRASQTARVPQTTFDLHKPEVETRVARFQTHLRDFFDRALLRSAKYVPTITEILVREGLPAELAYVPLIESGYRPQAVSPAGAVGPWQFISETGKRYGLRIDSMVDERRDPIKSTQAAVQYLKDLHGMFGDWELSLAAYNSGEYRVARILAETDVDDFWDMRDRGYLPSETSEYVPRFLAAVRIASAPQRYGFESPTHVPFRFETVRVDRQVSLQTAAGFCGVPTSELAELNPALRRGVTPTGYALRVPAGKAEPLRVALTNYVEPTRAARRTRRGTPSGARSSRVAKSGHRVREIAKHGAPPRTRVGNARRTVKRSTASSASKGSRRRRSAKPSLARSRAPAKSHKAGLAAPKKRRRS
jgi:hypothetical protein